jgi:GNAT superfamily N-acetyltransferase
MLVMNDKTFLSIREYEKSDLSIVLDLHRRALEAVDAYIDDASLDIDLRNIEEHYFANNGSFLVGTIDGAIVTMGAFRKLNSNTAEIKRMRTYPEQQGKGYGTKILRRLIQGAKLLGYAQLILETSDKQLRARRLYAKMGFREFKKERLNGLNCTWFKLTL